VTRHFMTRHPGDCDNTLIGARLVFEETKPNCLFDLLPPIIHIPENSAVAPVFRSMLHVLAGEKAAGKMLGATVVRSTMHTIQSQGRDIEQKPLNTGSDQWRPRSADVTP
jgi:hypothetical protein